MEITGEERKKIQEAFTDGMKQLGLDASGVTLNFRDDILILEGNREVWIKRSGKVCFNCGTHPKGCRVNTIKPKNLLRACIIQLEDQQRFDRSSYKERKGNALASGAEEGRDKLR